MILNEEYAQKFVDRIIENIGYNVNIMNNKGVIIASGNKERIGDYHKIAWDVIKLNKRIDVTEEYYDGVKNGINMPFYYEDDIAGVIGITGDPIKLEDIASVVKMSVEIMLEQQYLKEKMYLDQNQKTFFVNKLLRNGVENNYPEIQKWSQRLGYNIELPRCVCLISLKALMKIEKDIVRKKNLKNEILKDIEGFKHKNSEDIISEKSMDKIIICKYLNSLEGQNIKAQLMDYFDEMNNVMKNKYGIGLLVGVGSYHKEGINEMKESYLEAKAMLDFAVKSKYREGTFFVEEHVFEYLFYSIPYDKLKHFLDKYKKRLKGSPELISTIQCLIKSNMNILETSKELYVHRNTVIYRMEKIKEILYINPFHNEKDRILLRLIDLYLL